MYRSINRILLQGAQVIPPAMALSLKKKAHVRCALDLTHLTVLPREDFFTFCTKSSSVAEEQMSLTEAESYLDALTRAGVVLQHNGNVYLRPKKVLDEVYSSLRLPPLNTEHPEEHMLRDECVRALEENEKRLRLAAHENALWRRRFWAGVALASGLQMLGLSYLTFIVYGWDTMEPICYFITASTAFASYLYFVAKSKDHTYNSIDTDVLFNEGGKEVGGGGKESSATLRVHARKVAELVQRASVDRALEEARDDLVNDLLKDSAVRATRAAKDEGRG